MRSLLLVLSFVLLALVSWGVYGPILHAGQLRLGGGGHPASLRAFICVGLAYFLIAVVVPLLAFRGQEGRAAWTVKGAVWSFLAGAFGALGALGIVLAFKFHGSPVYVMPLVFGLAPVVHTFLAMSLGQTFKDAGPLFFSGVILIAVGAAGVLGFKPTHAANPPVGISNEAEAARAPAVAPVAAGGQASAMEKLVLIPLFIVLAALCWGSYGPLLHKGQMQMADSRLRPFVYVGLAYLVIAVLLPLPLLQLFREPGGFNFSGTVSSFAGGAAGAVGALGILMAFHFGGKPFYVMPLVFGGAPVVNTFTIVLAEGTSRDLSPLFLASLMVLVAGAATVLAFAPRPAKPADEVKPPPEPPARDEDEATLPADEEPPSPADDPMPETSDSDSSSDGASDEELEDTVDVEETSERGPSDSARP